MSPFFTIKILIKFIDISESSLWFCRSTLHFYH